MHSKIPRLNTTDAANNASLPSSKKPQHLLEIVQARSFFPLDPVKDSFPAIVRADSTLPLALEDGKDEALLEYISGKCKHGNQQRTVCLAIATSLIAWRNKEKVKARFPSVTPYRLSVETIRFASDVVLIKDGKPIITCLDLRANQSLTMPGREVVKSILWHTARIGNLANAEIGLLRTPSVGKGHRVAILEPLLGDPKYDLSALDRMFAETYSIWQAIWIARRASSAKQAKAGGDGFI